MYKNVSKNEKNVKNFLKLMGMGGGKSPFFLCYNSKNSF